MLWTVSAFLGLDSACPTRPESAAARCCQPEGRQHNPTAFRSGDAGERLLADRTSKDQESLVQSQASSKLAGIPGPASNALHLFGRTSGNKAHFLSLSMRWQV